ncbi:sugar nucleotide-binding protein [Maribacter cobaltidurans]|uniref:sugar nucleotide-binding protein n=1 Tax=Maribacter cobaltidurans TaxID=1178778 RepID=UPI001E522E75|nr:sugar nucleotide-binding protein [Maribacter cobaltidurans]
MTDSQIGCPAKANNLTTYILNLILKNVTDFGIHHFTDKEPMTWYEFTNKILSQNNIAN